MYLATRNVRRKRRRDQSNLLSSGRCNGFEDNEITQGSQTSSKRSRTTKNQPDKHLSLLEQLPNELLQEILYLSMNCSLPLASSHLASSLSSMHIFLKYSMIALHGDLGGRDPCLETQSRLLDCRFFTFSFLKLYVSWANGIHAGKCQGNKLYIKPLSNFDGDIWSFCKIAQPYMRWNPEIHMPEKLFRESWKDDKIEFFRLLGFFTRREIPENSPRLESALQGIKAAIDENRVYPLMVFHPWLGNNLAAWQELLEHAVNTISIEQTILETILNLSCWSFICLQESEYNWELAFEEGDKGIKIFYALKKHQERCYLRPKVPPEQPKALSL